MPILGIAIVEREVDQVVSAHQKIAKTQCMIQDRRDDVTMECSCSIINTLLWQGLMSMQSYQF